MLRLVRWTQARSAKEENLQTGKVSGLRHRKKRAAECAYRSGAKMSYYGTGGRGSDGFYVRFAK